MIIIFCMVWLDALMQRWNELSQGPGRRKQCNTSSSNRMLRSGSRLTYFLPKDCLCSSKTFQENNIASPRLSFIWERSWGGKKSIKFSSNSAACRAEMYFPSMDQREKASLHLCEIPGVSYRLARSLKIINTLSLARVSITSPQTANLDIGISLVGLLQCQAIKQRRIIGSCKGEGEATLINSKEKKTWAQGSRK